MSDDAEVVQSKSKEVAKYIRLLQAKCNGLQVRSSSLQKGCLTMDKLYSHKCEKVAILEAEIRALKSENSELKAKQCRGEADNRALELNRQGGVPSRSVRQIATLPEMSTSSVDNNSVLDEDSYETCHDSIAHSGILSPIIRRLRQLGPIQLSGAQPLTPRPLRSFRESNRQRPTVEVKGKMQNDVICPRHIPPHRPPRRSASVPIQLRRALLRQDSTSDDGESDAPSQDQYGKGVLVSHTEDRRSRRRNQSGSGDTEGTHAGNLMFSEDESVKGQKSKGSTLNEDSRWILRDLKCTFDKRPHGFELKYSMVRDVCDHCGGSIAFTVKKAKCKECCTVVHAACQSDMEEKQGQGILLPCIPTPADRRPPEQMTITQWCSNRCTPCVPYIVIACILNLESRDLSRVTVQDYCIVDSRLMTSLLNDFRSSRAIPPLDGHSTVEVVTTMRAFLEALPEPLLPKSVASNMLEVLNSTAGATLKESLVGRELSGLPAPCRDTLTLILGHLQRVLEMIDRKIENMDRIRFRLSTAFAPALFGYDTSMFVLLLKLIALPPSLFDNIVRNSSCTVLSPPTNFSKPPLPLQRTNANGMPAMGTSAKRAKRN